ncbi:MAG: hypothetical protein M1828_007027 [Chrysothrix sp. TS-e1954]|nr:MAG: hypothetical protein M1828_007027 [Chrysothrix sp. TS-e1954]
MPSSKSTRSLTLYLALGCILVLTTVYLLIPAAPPPQPLRKTAEERLRLWADFVTPEKNQVPLPPQVEAPDTPAIGLDPFPLGSDVAATHPDDLAAYNSAKEQAALVPKPDPAAFLTPTESSPPSKDHDVFDDLELLDDTTEALLDLPQTATNLSDFADYFPHNYDQEAASGQQKTFATYLFTRNPSLSDAYFASALQLTYRMLWDLQSRTKAYPLTIFVSPSVSALQRSILAGAGALVRELPLLYWKPNTPLQHHQHAQVSKLHMWNQTQFSRIAFLSTDAHPLVNIDRIFAHAEEPSAQRCVASELQFRDAQHIDDMCRYTFAVGRLPTSEQIDPEVMVFSPNFFMHKRLVRAAGRTDKFDNEHPDRGLLMWMFAGDGPFPGRFLDRHWDAVGDLENEERGKISIVHEEALWRSKEDRPEWMRGMFASKWMEMVRFFDDKDFAKIRRRDGLRS